jgi:hypothetical protein
MIMWGNEGGVIDKAVRPAINRRMRERNVFVDIETYTSIKDKRAKCVAFGARVSARTVWLPKLPWAYELVEQLIAMPAGRYDDKADVAGLFGRMLDRFTSNGRPLKRERSGIKPFSVEWLEHKEKDRSAEVCYR